jgi:hypothetical protein
MAAVVVGTTALGGKDAYPRPLACSVSEIVIEVGPKTSKAGQRFLAMLGSIQIQALASSTSRTSPDHAAQLSPNCDRARNILPFSD